MTANADKDVYLITGGAGMLAHAFQQTLEEHGRKSVLVARADCDLTHPAAVIGVLDRVQPTVVLNCAAYTKVDLAEKEQQQAMDVNGKAVGTLAEACKRVGATLVHFSTDYVFDGTLRRPLKIDDPIGPKGLYGLSKALGEQMLKEFAPPRWIIARTAWLYGPNGPNFPQAMLNAARAGKPLKVINDQFGCPTYTFDVAAATLALLDAGASGTFHLSNSGETNWFDFARAIFAEFNVTPTSLEAITSDDWKRMKPDSANRPAYSVLDVSDFERATGHTMPDWRDALHRYHERIGG